MERITSKVLSPKKAANYGSIVLNEIMLLLSHYDKQMLTIVIARFCEKVIFYN